MSEDDKKLPDSYVPNAYALPYASNLSSPVIKPDKLGGWKVGAVHSANKHFDERFEKLKQEFHNLANEFKWNEIIFNSEMRFKPVIGREYCLYQKNDGSYFMSLFNPDECSWGKDLYKGKFRLNYDNRWDIIDCD
tara:strand:- start:434 stop:838 length:405 start_codon:yes stop_codon:yes gene_type:complete